MPPPLDGCGTIVIMKQKVHRFRLRSFFFERSIAVVWEGRKCNIIWGFQPIQRISSGGRIFDIWWHNRSLVALGDVSHTENMVGSLNTDDEAEMRRENMGRQKQRTLRITSLRASNGRCTLVPANTPF